jgi:uncharacterized membrane protein YadS
VALFVLALGLLASSHTATAAPGFPLPWFVLGFVALITWGLLPFSSSPGSVCR